MNIFGSYGDMVICQVAVSHVVFVCCVCVYCRQIEILAPEVSKVCII